MLTRMSSGSEYSAGPGRCQDKRARPVDATPYSQLIRQHFPTENRFDEPQLVWPVHKELNILARVVDRCWPIFRRNADVDLIPPKTWLALID